METPDECYLETDFVKVRAITRLGCSAQVGFALAEMTCVLSLALEVQGL